MIGTFPRRGAWITVQLATGDDGQPRLLELTGECPADPAARTTRATTCESAHDALAHAAAWLARGWAEHAAGEQPAGRRAAAPELPARAWRPAAEAYDRRLAPDVARAAVAHAVDAGPEPFCLIPNPTAARRAAHTKESTW